MVIFSSTKLTIILGRTLFSLQHTVHNIHTLSKRYYVAFHSCQQYFSSYDSEQFCLLIILIQFSSLLQLQYTKGKHPIYRRVNTKYQKNNSDVTNRRREQQLTKREQAGVLTVTSRERGRSVMQQSEVETRDSQQQTGRAL